MNRPKRVVIIGGGVIGLSCAYYLHREGCEVLLFDKGEFGEGSSMENAGYVSPSHFIPLASPGIVAKGLRWMLSPESPFYIKPRLSFDLYSWLWHFYRSASAEHVRRSMHLLRDLAQESLRGYEEIASDEAIAFGLQKRGLLMLYNSEGGEKSFNHEAELAQELGVEARLLDREGLRQLEPSVSFASPGGLYYPGDAHISPSQFMSTFSGRLQTLGVTMRKNSEVLNLVASSSRIEGVRTDDGAVEADAVVLAAGAWSPRLARPLGLRLPLQAGKGYSMTLTPPPLPNTIPAILSEARVAITPFGDSLRLAGTMELAGLDLTVNARRVAAIVRAVPKYLPDFDPASANRATPWRGLRPCSPDGLPYIGRFRRFPNLIAATGHAMVGISMGPMTGKLVSELIVDRPTSLDISLLAPERFS